ncbi:hypothetical protein E4M02_02630 [Brevundimonas sp. S30B]|uniref:phage tail protein n=1 Tax=unclassified Brevundimonas TaxID=2622653 RepID=UPI0010716CE7|nr:MULTISPECIES: phage tail protein [unclassified Brevundimonas]QBX37214.1 hypothetical protein E4M01_05190 [Brevundimonas sp. MF30-B]TFW03992.1 hypothetical protein E4M02_02630 [Brevundimonas sp. S30B]
MGKTLKTAGAIIGGAVLIATGVGAIAGLQVTAIGIAGIGTASISSLQMASAGLMAVGGLLDKPKSQASANPTDWTSNPDQPTPFLFGRMGVTGKIIHRDEWGKDNHAQSFVHVFSGAGPVRAFVSFSADDVPITFASNGGSATGSRNGQMYRSWRLGAQPDTALSLPPMSGPAMPMWGAAYRLSGKACDLWTLTQDSKLSVYPGNAEPKPLSVIDGIYGYDPRYDSTYPGGMGACRLGVRSTYLWIENPIIAALNWSLGMVENGKIVGGVGVSPRGIDFPAFVDAANTADANGWKIAAWPDTSEDVSSVLDQMLQAGGAVRARHAGKISCVSRGAPRPSIVTITRQDTAGAIELDTGASRFNRLNTITPRFMSAAHKWQATPAAPVSFPAYVTEDGGRRSDLIDYRFVPSVKQAAELAAYDILDAREPFSGTIPLKPHLRQLKRGDCFTINEPNFVLNGVKCIVLSRGYDPKTGIVRVAFRSETDSKHPLALGKTTELPAYPDLTPPDPTFVSPPEPGDVTVTPRPPVPGGQVPGFDLSIVVSNPTVTTVLVEFWEVPDGTDPNTPPPAIGWKSAGIWPPTTTDVPISVEPGRWYWIGLTNRRGDSSSARVVDGPHLSPGLVAGDLIPTAPSLVALEEELAALEALQASETVLREQADSLIIARSASTPNLVRNGGAIEGTEGWHVNSGGPLSVAHGSAQGSIFFGTGSYVSDVIPCGPGDVKGLSIDTELSGGFAYLSFLPSFQIAQFVSFNTGSWTRKRSTSAFPAPEGTTGVRVVIDTQGVPAYWSRVKVNSGPVATDWSDDATQRDLAASVSEQRLAIVDLETGQALAKFELIAAASGGKPARFRLVSSSLGSAAAIDAPFIYWGDNTVFDDATDTLQTTIGSLRRVLALGSPFGAASNLLEWWGPSSIALSAMTTANGLNGRMTNSPYVFDNTNVTSMDRAPVTKPLEGFIGLSASTAWQSTYSVTSRIPVNPYLDFDLSLFGGSFASESGSWNGEARWLEYDLSGGAVIAGSTTSFGATWDSSGTIWTGLIGFDGLLGAKSGPNITYELQTRRLSGSAVAASDIAINGTLRASSTT